MKRTCRDFGYNVGDTFRVIDKRASTASVGDILTLVGDDGSMSPWFTGSTHPNFKDYVEVACLLEHLEPFESHILIGPLNNIVRDALDIVYMSLSPSLNMDEKGFLFGNVYFKVDERDRIIYDIMPEEWDNEAVSRDIQYWIKKGK